MKITLHHTSLAYAGAIQEQAAHKFILQVTEKGWFSSSELD